MSLWRAISKDFFILRRRGGDRARARKRILYKFSNRRPSYRNRIDGFNAETREAQRRKDRSFAETLQQGVKTFQKATS